MGNLQQMTKLTEKYVNDNIYPRGLSTPAPGLFTCIWPPFSKILLSKTAGPIIAKFYVEPPWKKERKFI